MVDQELHPFFRPAPLPSDPVQPVPVNLSPLARPTPVNAQAAPVAYTPSVVHPYGTTTGYYYAPGYTGANAIGSTPVEYAQGLTTNHAFLFRTLLVRRLFKNAEKTFLEFFPSGFEVFLFEFLGGNL